MVAMNDKEWKSYVKKQLEKRNKKSEYISTSLFRLIPVSVFIGIFASVTTIYFWGVKEWARMIMQLVLGVTLAATVFASYARQLDRRFRK